MRALSMLLVEVVSRNRTWVAVDLFLLLLKEVTVNKRRLTWRAVPLWEFPRTT